MSRTRLLVATAAVGLLGVATASAEPENMHVLHGACSAPESHTSEGPLGSDLTQRHSAYFCDTAVIFFFSQAPGKVMLQFTDKRNARSQILGYAGRIEPDGRMVDINHLYLEVGHALPVSNSYCKFFFSGKKIGSIFCGAKVDEDDRRTVAVVVFRPDGSPEE